MEESNNLIYGLEFQARALASQVAEPNVTRFFIATLSLKPNNQVHMVELNENATHLIPKVFSHPLGEVWKLNSNPHNVNELVSCYSSQTDGNVNMSAAILTLPNNLNTSDESKDDFKQFSHIEVLKMENTTDLKTCEFHPTNNNLLGIVVDRKIVLHQRAESETKPIGEITAKNSPKFIGGKWSPHNQGNQFIALHDCSIYAYDIRDPLHTAWTIDEAHSQLVRDVDCNPNKHCHLATGGDDGCLKIWDTRNTKESIFMRHDHSHWIWNVRFNTCHDQLLLSSSSDGKVNLTSAVSVSSEAAGDVDVQVNKQFTSDGLLQTFEHHEDSVYCVEWSSADPWIFASLSYDGRLIVAKIPKQFKYQILL